MAVTWAERAVTERGRGMGDTSVSKVMGKGRDRVG